MAAHSHNASLTAHQIAQDEISDKAKVKSPRNKKLATGAILCDLRGCAITHIRKARQCVNSR